MKRLLKLISTNNIKEIEERIAAGININKTHNGVTPLFVAALNNNLAIAKLLMDAGANVNGLNDERISFTCPDDNIKEMNYQRMAPLHIATKRGHIEMVRLLMQDVSIDLNLGRNHGNTAFVIAARLGHLEILQILFSAGADVNKVYSGFKPLPSAARNGHVDVVKFLLQLKDKIHRFHEQATMALGFAAKFGHTEIVGLLINQGADINTKCVDITPPVKFAAENGYDSILRLLLKAGVDIHASYCIGMPSLRFSETLDIKKTLLYLAANHHKEDGDQHERCTRLLLHAGAQLAPEEQPISSPVAILVNKIKKEEELKSFISYDLMPNTSSRFFSGHLPADITRMVQNYIVKREVRDSETIADINAANNTKHVSKKQR